MMKDFLYFQSMLTPKFITLIYWLSLGVIALGGVGYVLSNPSLAGFVQGIIGSALGMLSVRIWCELMIVLFKIHENLSTLVSLKKDKPEA